jgi:hypothetical protein
MKGYTLSGAKKVIYSRKKRNQPDWQQPAAASDDNFKFLEDIKKELQQVIKDF